MNFKINSSALVLIFFLALNTRLSAQQPIYADVRPVVYSKGIDVNTGLEHPTTGSSVAYADRANEVMTIDATPATLTVEFRNPYYGILGFQLIYAANVAAESTTFIRIDKLKTATNIGLNEYDYANLLGTVLSAEAYTDEGSTAGKIADSQVSVEVVVNNKDVFLAVTPKAQYRSVRLNFSWVRTIKGLSTGDKMTLQVFYAFYHAANPLDCGATWASNLGTTSGGSLALADAVVNPKNSFDSDSTTTFSTVKTDVGGATSSESIFFTSPSTEPHKVRLTLAIPAGYLNSEVFSRITVQYYLGSSPLAPAVSLASLVTGDLMSKFSGGKRVVVMQRVTGIYDRIVITVNSGSGPAAVNVYHVTRLVEAAFVTNKLRSCFGTSNRLQIANPSTALTYTWYDSSKNVIASNANKWEYVPPSLSPGVHLFFVSATKAGCTTSPYEMVQAEVTVYQKPGPPSVNVQ